MNLSCKNRRRTLFNLDLTLRAELALSALASQLYKYKTLCGPLYSLLCPIGISGPQLLSIVQVNELSAVQQNTEVPDNFDGVIRSAFWAFPLPTPNGSRNLQQFKYFQIILNITEDLFRLLRCFSNFIFCNNGITVWFRGISCFCFFQSILQTQTDPNFWHNLQI